MDIDDKGLFASFLSDEYFFMFSLEAAKNSGMAKILAEPTLTTMSGQNASFLSGGEFPVPVAGENGSVKVSYKDYGVGVKFTPTILTDNRIHLDLDISVSEVQNANNISVSALGSATYIIPGLTKRTASSSVELEDGQTIAIAGLINENIRDIVNKFPLLGDLPILGALFKSKDFQKGETELLILVTPTLAKPVDRNHIVLPTDGYVEPNDLEFYLMGKGLHKKSTQTASSETQASEQPNTNGNSESHSGQGSEAQISSHLESDLLFERMDAETSVREGVSSGHFGHAY